MEGEFLWSPEMQGYVLGTSFICYTIAMPIFSKVAETYGCKKILFFCILFSSLFTFLSPFAARWNVYAFIVVQTLRGISQAGTYPAKAILIANWCPKQEIGFLFTITVCGIPLGAVVGSSLSGVLCESAYLGGWSSAFYVNGSIGFIGSAVVWFFLFDNPSVHPRISTVELEYILKNQENVLREKRPKTPWKSILTSVPVYALGYAQFGEVWAMGYFLTVNPTFLKTILHYSVEQDGLFNALPFLLQIFVSQIGGILSKLFISRKWLTVDKSRKFWTILSTFGYSLCVLGIYFAGCNRNRVLILSISAMSFLAFSFSGSWIASPDMSPTFAGTVCGIVSSIGSIAHFLVPVTVGYLTDNSQTIEQWQKMFLVSIGVVCSSGLVFAIFGSAKIQPWNEVSEENQEREKEHKKKNIPK